MHDTQGWNVGERDCTSTKSPIIVRLPPWTFRQSFLQTQYAIYRDRFQVVRRDLTTEYTSLEVVSLELSSDKRKGLRRYDGYGADHGCPAQAAALKSPIDKE